jgi:hypothetical protein
MRTAGVRVRLGMACVGLALTAACVGQDRSDLSAVNVRDTGHYDVLSQQEPQRGQLDMKIRVEHLDKADQVARDIVLQKLNHNYRAIQVDVIGPDDKPDAPPRQQLRWPGDLDALVD